MAAGRVLLHVTMSLDGFIAGTGHDQDWVFEHGGPSAIADEVMRSTGAVLAGRGWYDIATRRYDGVDGIYGGDWEGPVLVLTHRPPQDADPRITFLSGDIEEAVTTARTAAEGANVCIFGADVARQCLEAGQLDQLVIHVAPLLLGDGVRLYDAPGARRVPLERTAVVESGDVTALRFEVVR